MISGLSAAFHAAKNHISKRISAKFKSRDVRVVPDPAKQPRSPLLPPTPTEEPPQLTDRKVDELDQPISPYLKPKDQPSLSKKSNEDEPVIPRRTNHHPNPLTYFSSSPTSDVDSQDIPQLHKDALAKLGFELSELKRDARRLRRTNLLQQYAKIEQTLKAQTIQETLVLLQSYKLASLDHHISVLESLLSTETPKPPVEPEVEPIEPESEPIEPESEPISPVTGDEEDIPDIPTDVQLRPVQYFRNGTMNMVIGDITRLKQHHNIPVEAILCPAGGLAKYSQARDQVLAAEPEMAKEAFQTELNRIESGRSALMPAVGLADQGVKYIVHPLTPRPGEPESHNLLLTSYVQSIAQAMEKGVSSIALPVIGDERIGLSQDNACKLALGAAMHCIHSLPEGRTPPKIYFVFPDNPEARPLAESMQQKLEDIPDKPLSSPNDISNKLPVIRLSEKDTTRLMAKILPYGHALTTRGKVKWMNKEVEELCKMMYQGRFDYDRYSRITAYLHNAQMKMYNLVEKGSITPSECLRLNDYLDQRTEMLEIYERKYGKLVDRRMLSKDVERYDAESHFASCPATAKLAFVNQFDDYCEQAFKAHHLRPMPSGPTSRAEKTAGKINRPAHGVMNAGRTALWVKALIHLYQKHGNEEAEKIREEEIPLIQMAAIYNTSSTHANRQQRGREGASSCKHALMDEGVDEATADQISSAIAGRDKPYSPQDKSIIEKVLHDAVALEKLRHCESFELEQELDFAKEFDDKGMAIADIGKMTKEVAKVIHRQKDMMKAPVVTHNGSAISSSPSASFSASQKVKWEHAEHPYSALEQSVESHSPFLDELLNDN